MNERLSATLTRFNLLIVLACVVPAASALSTDKDQDIEIESDAAMVDDVKNISIYTGDVVVIQGSMRLSGDKMTVYYTENKDLGMVVMEGQLAKFRQLADNNTVYDEAEALVMEYHRPENLIILINKASVNQAGTRLSGDRIEYDTVASRIRANKTRQAGTQAGTENQDARVKIIIPKKKTDDPVSGSKN